MVAVPFVFTVVALATSWTAATAPATKVTVVLALNPAADAVTVAVPGLVGAIRFTVATPLAFVVAAAVVADAAKLPAVVAKVTVIPESGPEAPCTVALMATAFTPLATTGLVAPLATLIDATEEVDAVPPDGAVTVIEIDPATLALVACARTVSAPPVVPAVYFTVTCPLRSVAPLVGLSEAPLILVENVNVTVSPGTGLPLASVTAAVSVEVPPAFTVLGEVLSCTRAAGPGTNKISMCVRKPMASAVTAAVPAVVPAVRSTCAMPLASVVTVTCPLLSTALAVVA
jgi:hypothetical protein